MRCHQRRSNLRGLLVGAALFTLLVGAGLEAEGLVRSQLARQSLRNELTEAAHAAPDAGDRQLYYDLLWGHVRYRHDAGTALALVQRAEARQTAEAWHLASVALTWDGERERSAARAATRAAKLAPADPALAAAEEAAVDALLWAEMRETSRPLSAVAGVVLGLAFVRWLHRRGHARRRRQWIDLVRARLVVNADGAPAPAGSDPFVTPDTRSLALDIFLDGAGPLPARDGPTLSVVLSHGRESRVVRLTPVRDVRQDALRVGLSDATLAEVLAHPGRWRVTAALDGRHVGEAALRVESALAAARR